MLKVEDEDKVFLLLCFLLISYKSFRDLMVYSREIITLEDVKSNLKTMLHLDNEMINIENGSSSVGLFMDRSRLKEINLVWVPLWIGVDPKRKYHMLIL
jgi:hypothetical protein